MAELGERAYGKGDGWYHVGEPGKLQMEEKIYLERYRRGMIQHVKDSGRDWFVMRKDDDGNWNTINKQPYAGLGDIFVNKEGKTIARVIKRQENGLPDKEMVDLVLD